MTRIGPGLVTDRLVVSDDGVRLRVQVHDIHVDSAPEHGVPEHGVTEHGLLGAGAGVPTVVLAHGWTLDHRSWEPVVARLRAAYGIRVVTGVQRGHGGSTLAGGGAGISRSTSSVTTSPRSLRRRRPPGRSCSVATRWAA
ncbi:MAG: hypothetical protein ABI083_03690 [Lapillicoccus sp.]